MKRTAVIMAGGKGERFWPKSRTDMPKQFLSLTSDGKTMLQLTAQRLLRTVSMEDIFISTNKNYKSIVMAQLPTLPVENILCEPMAKNTAPCIAYAAAIIGAKYSDAVICVVPSDHIIKNERLFSDTLNLACDMAEKDANIVTLGITPTYPETGYGYIKFAQNKSIGLSSIYEVEKFVEKPELETARRYMVDGSYLWNSGIFLWKVSTVESNLKAFLPALYDGMQKIKATANTPESEVVIYDVFEKCVSVSVDYGIMEKAKDIYTIPGSFGWDDVGSWLSLARINNTDEKGNYISGNVAQIGAENSILVSEGRLVAAVGVQNIIVVETGDITLVCDKDKTQDVKKIVEKLRAQGAVQYL